MLNFESLVQKLFTFIHSLYEEIELSIFTLIHAKKKMPLDIDLNVAFTFPEEQSSFICETIAPSNIDTPQFEFELNHPSHLIVGNNMNQDVP